MDFDPDDWGGLSLPPTMRYTHAVHSIRSELLLRAGFRHAFSSRAGGVSQGHFSSLNLGRGIGDDPDAVEENHRRLADHLHYPTGSLFEVSQVHGARLRQIQRGESPAAVRQEEADGLWTAASDIAIGVRTADCVPLLLACPELGAVAAVHAGWRGVAAGILGAAIDALAARSCSPQTLLLAIGPHIRQRAFEIGEDVAERLAASAPKAEVVARQHGRLVASLSAALRQQAIDKGIAPTHIDDVIRCTHDESDTFFSHRRERGATGRHLAVIVSKRPGSPSPP